MEKREKSDLLEFFENVVIIYFLLSMISFFFEFAKGLFDKDTAFTFWVMLIIGIIITYFII
jgi:hypothetical protein